MPTDKENAADLAIPPMVTYNEPIKINSTQPPNLKAKGIHIILELVVDSLNE